MKLFDLAKTELLSSDVEREHPFRYFCLATFGQYPEVRTVVKRKTEHDLSCVFFADSRSSKVEQIRENEIVSALFYHPKKMLQIRMKGIANILEEEGEDFAHFISQIKQAGALKDYATSQAPGSAVTDESEILFGSEVHFAAIKIIPHHLDVLLLGETHHTRSAYSLHNGTWRETKLVP